MTYRDKDKQRTKTRERVRRYRERQSQPKGVTSVTGFNEKALPNHTQGVTKGVTSAESVTPFQGMTIRPVTPSVEPRENLLSNLRAKTQAIIDQPAEEVVKIPVYNRNIHKPGDTVLLRGKVTIVEETDGEGNVIPEY